MTNVNLVGNLLVTPDLATTIAPGSSGAADEDA